MYTFIINPLKKIMKNSKIFGMLFMAVLFSVVSLSSCEDTDEKVNPPVVSLTQEEQDLLIYMREEEKLARDVYQHFYALYNLDIFNNIASSEQKHTDKIKDLLIQYNLEDPFLAEYGVFSNDELQTLYNALIAQGENNLVDALIVGATIEDVDIFDLNNAIAQTSHTDIINVYEKLTCGSRNHIRAFTDQLDTHNVSYTPSFISQAEYDDILLGEHESCGRH